MMAVFIILYITKISVDLMRYRVFASTLVAYMTIHMMRMSLSFVQADLIDFFDVKKSIIGLAMASVYIIMGISYFIRTIIPLKKLQFTYLVTVGITALSYSLTAIVASLGIHRLFALFLSLAFFGLFQSSSWPILIKISHKYFHRDKDGFALGLWSSAGQIGNATGFLIFTVIQFYLKFNWNANIYFCAAVAILLATIIYSLPIENPQDLQQSSQGADIKKQFCDNFMKIFNDPTLALTFILYCLLKSLIYGVLLWMPTYFQEGGFGDFKGYILVTMNLFGIFGSILAGRIYQKIQSPIKKQIIFILAQVVMACSFYMVIVIRLDVQNKWIFLFLISLIGLTLIGNFNAINTHSATLIAEEHGIDLGYLASLLMAFGNTSVGIVEIIIGFAVTQSSDSIFIIFFILSLIILVLFIVRTFFIWSDSGDNSDKSSCSSAGSSQQNQSNSISQSEQEQQSPRHK